MKKFLNNKYCQEVLAQADFEQLIKIIYPILNKVLKINKTKLYWEIVLYHWLKGFLVYCNMNKKKNYSKKINDKFAVKDTKYFFDNLDSSNEIFYKKFNHLFYSIDKNINKLIYYDMKFTVISSVIFFFKKTLWILFSIIFKSNFYINTSLSRSMTYKIFLQSKFKFFTIFNTPNFFWITRNKKNSCRYKLKKLIDLNNNLSQNKKRILKLIAILLPITFLENYKKILKKNKTIIKFNPPNIFVDGGQIKNDQMNIIIAEWVSRGSILNTIQHAAHDINFNISSFNHFNHNYANYFITWGYKGKKNIALPSIRLLSAIKGIKKSKKKYYDIIFFPSEFRKFPTYSYYYDLNLQKKKLISFNKLIQKIYKTKKIKFAINYKSILNKDIFKFNSNNMFYLNKYAGDIYNQTKLNVFNHLSTGFIECIFSNIPAVLYLPNKNYLTQESNSLEELNQLFDRYNLIYDNENNLVDIIRQNKTKLIKNNIKKIQKDLTFKKFYLNPANGIDIWTKYIKND